jgi:hypothetical protein
MIYAWLVMTALILFTPAVSASRRQTTLKASSNEIHNLSGETNQARTRKLNGADIVSLLPDRDLLGRNELLELYERITGIESGSEVAVGIAKPLLHLASPVTRSQIVSLFGEPDAESTHKLPGLATHTSQGETVEMPGHFMWFGSVGFGSFRATPDSRILALAYDPKRAGEKR